MKTLEGSGLGLFSKGDVRLDWKGLGYKFALALFSGKLDVVIYCESFFYSTTGSGSGCRIDETNSSWYLASRDLKNSG